MGAYESVGAGDTLGCGAIKFIYQEAQCCNDENATTCTRSLPSCDEDERLLADGQGGWVCAARPYAGSGNDATAMGYNTNASGDYATAMGYETTASGPYTTAMGRETTASGDYATAMGRHFPRRHRHRRQ